MNPFPLFYFQEADGQGRCGKHKREKALMHTSGCGCTQNTDDQNAQGNFRCLLSLIFLPTDPNSSYFLSGDSTIPGFLFVFLTTMCRISDLGQSSEVRFLSFSVPLTLPFLRPLLCNSDDSAGTGPACWFIQMHLASAELCQTRSNKWMCS